MKNDPDLLASAKLGYINELEPKGFWSSPTWLAHRAGVALSKQGIPEPAKVQMSHGYSVRIKTIDGAEFLVKISGDHLEKSNVIRV